MLLRLFEWKSLIYSRLLFWHLIDFHAIHYVNLHKSDLSVDFWSEAPIEKQHFRGRVRLSYFVTYHDKNNDLLKDEDRRDNGDHGPLELEIPVAQGHTWDQNQGGKKVARNGKDFDSISLVKEDAFQPALPSVLREGGAQEAHEEHHAESYSPLHLSDLCLIVIWIADLEDGYDEDETNYEIENRDEERRPTNTHTVAVMIRHCFYDTLI